jgi:hypothetical protein
MVDKILNVTTISLRILLLFHRWLSTFLSRSSYVLRVISAQQEMTLDELQRQLEDRKHVQVIRMIARNLFKLCHVIKYIHVY